MNEPLTREIELAFQALECFGVPRTRAKTVANGIGVLSTRYDKEISALKTELSQLKKRLSEPSSCASCADNP